MFLPRKRLATAVLAAVAAVPASIPAISFAQNAQLEEVMITATRRQTDVQDVALAVTAISGEALESANIENLEDLTGTVPNVLIAGGNGGTTSASFYMRGIPNVGAYVDGIWQVSNSGLLTREFVELDRVEVLRGPQGTLYGRDSTGGAIQIHSKKPAAEFGGMVSINTGNLDRQDVVGSIDIPLSDNLLTKWTFGNYTNDGWIYSKTTGVNGGWMDAKTYRADILWMPTEDLEVRLIHSNDNQVGKQARVQYSIDFRNAAFLGYQVGIAQAHDIASGGKFNPQYAQACVGELSCWESRVASTTPNRQSLEQTTLHVDYDINENMHFKYMYGDTYMDNSVFNDWGGSEFNFFTNYYVDLTKVESHEFQLTGSLFNDRLDYVVGYYQWDQSFRTRQPEYANGQWINTGYSGHPNPQAYSNQGQLQVLDYQTVLDHPVCSMTPADYGYQDKFPNGWPFPCNWLFGGGWIDAMWRNGNSSDRLNGQLQDGDAIFFDATFYINDKWDVTFGMRDHEQTNTTLGLSTAGLTAQKMSGQIEMAPTTWDDEFNDRGWALAGIFDSSTDLTFGAETIHLATTYDFTDTIMGYVSYNEGFNSGGISQYEDNVGQISINYSPEIIENTEIGLRSDWLEGQLRANVTYFQTDWVGIQYLGTVIDRLTGTELTELVRQNSMDGEAKGLEVELTYMPTENLTLTANLGWLDTQYIPYGKTAHTSSTAFARAPEETYNFTAAYDFHLDGGAMVTARWVSNYWGSYWRADTLELRRDAQGFDTVPDGGDVWMHNTRITYLPGQGDWELSLWANNLTDEFNVNSGFMHGVWQFDFATVDRPREYGLQFKMHF